LAYFCNVFFGVRQSIELDSLRFAIDQLDDEVEKEWALGALVVTASSIATTYGGHFAQPPAPASRLADGKLARTVIARRHVSASREFELRLLHLATHSEEAPYPVANVSGPWRTALEQLEDLIDPSSSLVYLDAPYRREEYSRYYHVLETLTLYNYPDADAGARIPPKGSERFASEFFTRSEVGMADALAATLTAILERGFRCAWSYADRADADALTVLSRISGAFRHVRTLAVEHEFKRQGRSKESHRVQEYLFLLEP
jgi:adenine-specific DNA methylase